jgi:hypothetical protein
MRTRRLLVAAGVLALTVGTACELLVNGDLTFQQTLTEAGPNAPDASFDGSFCPYSVEPDTTAAGDDGDSGAGNIVVLAIRTINIGNPIGVDIDHLCTCQWNVSNNCVLPKDAPMGGACDADGGIDDRVADLYGRFPSNSALDFTAAANQFTACGQRAILIGLADYNGLKDDSTVKLNVVTSLGLYDPHLSGGDDAVDASACVQRGDAGRTYIPRWDGTDSWSVAPGNAIGPFPSTATIFGVVKNYQLVVDSRLPGQPSGASFIVNLFGATDVKVTQPIVLGAIRPTFADGGLVPVDDAGIPVSPGSSFLIFGTMIGRSKADDILRGAATAPLQPGLAVCNVPGNFFDTHKVEVCGYRDMVLDPSQDNTGKSCDAISTAFTFVAYPASLGTDHPPDPEGPNPCRPDQLTCDGVPPADAGTSADAADDAADAGDDASDGM